MAHDSSGTQQHPGASSNSGAGVEAFISRWTAATASERANSQLFLTELCDVLGVPHPDPTHHTGYSFEYGVVHQNADGSTSDGRIDLYKRGCFVLESKQFHAAQAAASQLLLMAQKAGVVEKKKTHGPTRGTEKWDDAMVKARGQAERYVRALPASETNPPFLIVVDVGNLFEVFADFTQAGKAYLPFPDPRGFRIKLEDLRKAEVRERLRAIWTNPTALDPARYSADVTREVAAYLAELAKSLEAGKHPPKVVADFLTRCLFCMFAEDVGLLPDRGFTELLKGLDKDGTGFVEILQQLFREMNTGTGKGISVVLRKKLLQFNGGLFADDTVLPVNGTQLGLLKAAAKLNWRSVEPAIFGTLLERALNPDERHKLGAHYTPRAYVERLVLPTVMEPLRAEWENVRAAALTLARKDKITEARREILNFHHKLCEVTVLDPACGSGNFLYVTLEHMKRLEGEVLDLAASFGENLLLELSDRTVDPHQFLGIEVNPRAASITELVLWIGYLQWHFRTRGQTMPAEPVLKKFKNIECRDAVLAWDGEPVPKVDETGKVVTTWDRRSFKKDAVTGREVPDETKQTPIFIYPNARQASWPKADFIVGNPPFVANRNMREDLGDGYVEALNSVFSDVTQAVDFVMLFWKKAAEAVLLKQSQVFGLVTTSRIRLQQNQCIPEQALSAGCYISFAIPDHPWPHGPDDAKVRIAMTVVRLKEPGLVRHTRYLIAPDHDTVASQRDDLSDEVNIKDFKEIIDREIPADLSPSIDISSAKELDCWKSLCHAGLKPYAETLLLDSKSARNLFESESDYLSRARLYRNGRDIAQEPRDIRVLDFFGFTEEEIRHRYPKAYQYLVTHTKDERAQERNPRLRKEWWLFEANRVELRKSVEALSRYIVTVENSPLRYFVFLESTVLPDQKLRVVASDDGFVLGVLSSKIHGLFSLRLGGRHGVANTPVYNSRCTTSFPICACNETTKERIRKIAEELDAHRKRVQAKHLGLTLTGMYNVLEKLRAGEALSAKEKDIHEKGLVSVLKQLHDELDEAVFEAYGWPRTLTDEEILERLVALNAERAEEEKRGHIRWLRPEYQNPPKEAEAKTGELGLGVEEKAKQGRRGSNALPVQVKDGRKPRASKKKQPWPKTMAEQVTAVEGALRSAGKAVTAEELTKSFARAKAEVVHDILDTLCALGRAHKKKGTEEFTV